MLSWTAAVRLQSCCVKYTPGSVFFCSFTLASSRSRLLSLCSYYLADIISPNSILLYAFWLWHEDDWRFASSPWCNRLLPYLLLLTYKPIYSGTNPSINSSLVFRRRYCMCTKYPICYINSCLVSLVTDNLTSSNCMTANAYSTASNG